MPASVLFTFGMDRDHAVVPVHPFYPQNLLLSNFIANDWDFVSLLAAFAAGTTLILGVTLAIVRKIRPGLKGSDQALVLWFVLTGSIHVFFEGYFVLNHSRMPSRQDFFGQLWKEYALSDSRYLLSDPLVLVMETLTATIFGPLSFLTALLISTNSQYRQPMQALVSTGHLYGNLLYLGTSLFDDLYFRKQYYRPEPYYFWCYFVFMNSIWLLVPGLCLYSSISASAKAFEVKNNVLVRKSRTKKRS